MDRRLFLDINHFAMRTAWAHGVMSFFARPYALCVLAALLLLALLRARLSGFGGSDIDQLAALCWAPVGTVLAYAIALPVVHLVGRQRPFTAVPKVLLLVGRPAGFSFPNEHAVVAAAIATGLWLGRARIAAALATVIALLIAFAAIYAGVAYPSDALVGLLIGTFVSVALYPAAIGSFRDLAHRTARSPVKLLVGGGHRASIGPGPAARPEAVGESGAVRILSREEVGMRRPHRAERASPVRILPPEDEDTVTIDSDVETGGIRILPSGGGDKGPDTTKANR